ncbi:glycoside hydrolase superfamily [Phaeosphaeriaceae sp. PMI808]|nr:glycoside hydrolase superfamily [Phaeosphaeriaceae sp. PMI808]
MKRLIIILPLLFTLAQAASGVYTGFNYGSFWGVGSNVKQAADFQESFNFAKNLSSKIPFNSARLYSCKTHGTDDEPTGAFDAAVKTKTNLLLGFWISPAKRDGPFDNMIKNELSALEKGFAKHGQALADLVIGLSVGSEDIYRQSNTKEPGVAASDVSEAIKQVKRNISASPFAQYMKGKPIGHVDTAEHAVVLGADFYGMTAYPYWTKEPIEQAKKSFHGSLEDVKQRAGNIPVWIAEIGWPFEGEQKEAAVASKDNLQKFWDEVGCSVVDMYTTFWFQLIKDSEINQPDWAILDATTHKPRINMRCPEESDSPSVSAAPGSGAPVSPSISIETKTSPTTLSTLPSPNQTIMASPRSQENSPTLGASTLAATFTKPNQSTSTVHVLTTSTATIHPEPSSSDIEIETTITTTVTSIKTVEPIPPSSKSELIDGPATSPIKVPQEVTPTPSPIVIPGDRPWCVTVADIAWDGQHVPIAGNPAGADGKCTSPPTYTGLPYAPSPSTVLQSSPASRVLEGVTSSAPVQPNSTVYKSFVASPASSPVVPSASFLSSTAVSYSSSVAVPIVPSPSPQASSSLAAPPLPFSSSAKQSSILYPESQQADQVIGSIRKSSSPPPGIPTPAASSTISSKRMVPEPTLPELTFPLKTNGVKRALEMENRESKGLFRYWR